MPTIVPRFVQHKKKWDLSQDLSHLQSSNNLDNGISSIPSRYSINSDTIHEAEEDSKSDADTVDNDCDMPALSEFLLTAADILSLR